jgi:hypothetical protein
MLRIQLFASKVKAARENHDCRTPCLQVIDWDLRRETDCIAPYV